MENVMWNKKDNRRMNNLCDIVLLLVVRRAPSFFLQNWSNKIIKSNQRLFQAICIVYYIVYSILYQRVRMIKIYEKMVLHSFYHSKERKKLNCLIWKEHPLKIKWEWPQLLPTSPLRTKSTSAREDHVWLCSLPSLQFKKKLYRVVFLPVRP